VVYVWVELCCLSLLAMADMYQSFDDALPSHGGSGGELIFNEKSFTKFCVYGFVSSKSWDLTYVVVVGHILRIYDSEETFQNQPENFVYQLELNHSHLCSMIFSKNYSKDPTNEIVIHYCYLLRDNGFWGPTKLLKIGNTNRGVIENCISQIKRVARAVRD
jgi:hypothetical protein